MNRRGLVTTATAIAIASMLCASNAHAQQAPETEGARLFRLGRAAMLDNRFDEACPMLAESQRLEPHVGTLLNLAACDERRGHYGSSWVEYQKALTAARADGQFDRVQLAEQRIAAIEPKVPWLRVSTTASDVVVTLDSGDLVRAALGTEMPVDPGPHLVTASRDGKRVFEERVEIREGEHRTVTITPLQPDLFAEGPRPEHVIVEPKQQASNDPATKALGRWVIEPGIFMGWMGGTMDHPRISSASSLYVIQDRAVAGDTPISCASINCNEAPLKTGSFLLGLSFLAGYAVSDSIVLGLRIFGAPAVANGGFFAFGPEVVLRATSSLSIGAFFTFGDVSLSGKTSARIPAGYRYAAGSSTIEADGTLAGGPGIGLDLSLKIADLQRGSLALTAMPTFMSGNGSAIMLPFGVAYRFQ